MYVIDKRTEIHICTYIYICTYVCMYMYRELSWLDGNGEQRSWDLSLALV